LTLKKNNYSFLFFFPLYVLSCLGTFSSNCLAEEASVKIHFIDVGYGDAAIIELPNNINIMIDAGEREQGADIMRYLQTLKIAKIHHAIITHPHENHFGGFLEMLDQISVEHFYTNGDQRSEEGYEELMNQIQQRNINLTELKEGDTIKGLPEGISIDIFKPGSLEGSINGNSLVTWFKFLNTSFLFMGDIGKKEQRELFVKHRGLSFSDVVTVPHHGKDIVLPFYRFFFNRIFIVSTGPGEWGMLDLTQLSKLKGKVYRTDQDSTIIITSDGQKVKVVHGQ